MNNQPDEDEEDDEAAEEHESDESFEPYESDQAEYVQEPRKLEEIGEAECLLTSKVWYNRCYMNNKIKIYEGDIKIVSVSEFMRAL